VVSPAGCNALGGSRARVSIKVGDGDLLFGRRGAAAPNCISAKRVPKYVPNSANLYRAQPNSLDGIALNWPRFGSRITFVMKGSPVQVRASALKKRSRGETQTLIYATPEVRGDRAEIAPAEFADRSELAHLSEVAVRDRAQRAAHDVARLDGCRSRSCGDARAS
jgi:hypothetical protein